MEPEAFTAVDAAPEMQSSSIGQLAKALSLAQAQIKALKKGREAKIQTKDGGSYSYGYADLADVIECCREALTKNSIAVVQPMRFQDGHLVLVTKLLHESGEWIASEFPLTLYAKPQEQGSAITYARRYVLSALLGISAEDDDDGKRAQDAEPRKAEAQPVSSDAAAILDVAAELSQITGMDTGTLIREVSQWTTKEGDVLWFTDPTERGYAVRNGSKTTERTSKPSVKWLKGTRERLERDLHKRAPQAEPGAAEAAELFTNDAV